MTIILKRATLPQDAAPVRALFLGYVDYLCRALPDERDAILTKYDPAKIDDLMDKFAQIHSRPTGDLLVAWDGQTAVGCGMMREFEPGVAEIQRLFVTDAARGKGLGRRLTLALMDQARRDGNRLMRLDTGKNLTGAIALYRSLGFREIAAYHNLTPQFADAIIYFECPLYPHP